MGNTDPRSGNEGGEGVRAQDMDGNGEGGVVDGEDSVRAEGVNGVGEDVRDDGGSNVDTQDINRETDGNTIKDVVAKDEELDGEIEAETEQRIDDNISTQTDN